MALSSPSASISSRPRSITSAASLPSTASTNALLTRPSLRSGPRYHIGKGAASISWVSELSAPSVCRSRSASLLAPPRRRWCRKTTAALCRRVQARAPARREPRTPGRPVPGPCARPGRRKPAPPRHRCSLRDPREQCRGRCRSSPSVSAFDRSPSSRSSCGSTSIRPSARTTTAAPESVRASRVRPRGAEDPLRQPETPCGDKGNRRRNAQPEQSQRDNCHNRARKGVHASVLCSPGRS